VSNFSITFDTRALQAAVNDLRDDVAQAERPAAQAGAQVLYDEVKRNVGALGQKTGNLARAIYQAYSKDQSANGQEVYHVSWNARKAPHGHLVEYGYTQRYQVIKDRRTGKWITIKTKRLSTPKQVPPKAFVRRAQAKFPQALLAIETEFAKRLKAFK
jgi:HK97 gp10 family phage protein